jgi:hypothetical protein
MGWNAAQGQNPHLRYGASPSFLLFLILFGANAFFPPLTSFLLPFPPPPLLTHYLQCANTGYTPGYTHFSCRAPRKSSDEDSSPVDLIAYLRSLSPLCDEISPGWSSRVGEDFARGHREATGGIIRTEEFEVLMKAVELGAKKEGGTPKKTVGGKKVIDPGQKTTLDGFFKIGGGKKKEEVTAKKEEATAKKEEEKA